MKKLLMPMLIILIAVQIIVPVSMVLNKYDTLRNGEEFKFKVRPVDPYDAFRGRYVSIAPEEIRYEDGKYGTIEVGEDGYARISAVSHTKPEGVPYIKSVKSSYFDMPIDRYYMDEKLAPEAERIVNRFEKRPETYVTVRVKNGSAVVSGLFADGIPIEEYIKREASSLE